MQSCGPSGIEFETNGLQFCYLVTSDILIFINQAALVSSPHQPTGRSPKLEGKLPQE